MYVAQSKKATSAAVRLSVLLALLCCPLLAQWKPVIATRTKIEESISTDGTVLHRRVVQERYYQNSAGSVLTQRLGDDGEPVTGILLDRQHSNKYYSIHYKKVSVSESGDLGDSTYSPEKKPHFAESLGHEVVNGIPCEILPEFMFVDGRKIMVGRMWVSTDFYFLILKKDSTYPQQYGTKLHVREELHDVFLTEPDSALFATDSDSIKRAGHR